MHELMVPFKLARLVPTPPWLLNHVFAAGLPSTSHGKKFNGSDLTHNSLAKFIHHYLSLVMIS